MFNFLKRYFDIKSGKSIARICLFVLVILLTVAAVIRAFNSTASEIDTNQASAPTKIETTNESELTSEPSSAPTESERTDPSEVITAPSDEPAAPAETSQPVETEPTSQPTQPEETEANSEPINTDVSTESSVDKDTVAYQEVNEIVYPTRNVNLRSGPGSNYEKLGSITKGTAVSRTAIYENGWSRVECDSQTVYVFTDYLSATKPADDATAGYTGIPSATITEFVDYCMQNWICPLKDEFGEVTGTRTFASSRSSGKRAHAGLDFVAPHGTKVYAITSGTVQRVAVFFESTLAVEVLNDDGSILRYCEISTSLRVGDRVEQGDVIGKIMRSDVGTEMLHMEVYYGDGEGSLTQTSNKTYTYVDNSYNFMRRSDLMDPTFLKDLKVE